jgi:hypothetical protein
VIWGFGYSLSRLQITKSPNKRINKSPNNQTTKYNHLFSNRKSIENMCGIVAYIGSQKAFPILIKGLQRLEYRGYDSAGVALQNSGIQLYKKKGKVADLLDFTREKDTSAGPRTANPTTSTPTRTRAATAAWF